MAFSNALRSLLLLSSILLSQQTSNDVTTHVLYSWRFADFAYPSEDSRSVAVQQRQFLQQNVAILDSDYFFSPITSTKRIFVTTPQFNLGIPATLSEVSRQRNANGEFLLTPFPSWDAQSQSTCDGPTSVYRIHIDKCGLLWVLDTGRVETFTNPRRACRPKLLIYDLKQEGDPQIERHEFPDGSINDRSNLITVVTESYQNNCLDSVAYIADVNAYGLVVYDLAQRTSWRVESNYFYPFPHKGTMTVNGVTFDLMDGIFGLALSPPTDKLRKLFFHSLASTREGWVPTHVLRNNTIVRNADVMRSQFYISDDVREGQSSLEVMTDDGVLIYSVLTKNALACWNSAHPFKKEYQHIVYQDDENLQFISGMKLKEKVLLVTTSRLQNYIAGQLNNNDVKYRVIVIDDVERLLEGTPCKTKTFGGKPSSFGGGKPPNYRPQSNTPQRQQNIPVGQQYTKPGASSSHY